MMIFYLGEAFSIIDTKFCSGDKSDDFLSR